jgi:acetyl-CoA C-acetyltransferase
MHKYAVGIYADTPGEHDLGQDDRDDAAEPLAGDGPVARTEQARGNGVIESWTVVYARDRSPARGIVYGRTDEGLRFVANSEEDAATFAALTSSANVVGRRVRLAHDAASGLNRASLDDA